MRVTLAALLFLGLATWSFGVVRETSARHIIYDICERVAQGYYDLSLDLSSWKARCQKESWEASKQCQTRDSFCLGRVLNQSLSLLGSSHLFIAFPVASQRFYQHRVESNGLKLRWIEGRVVVVGYYPGSAADGSGLQFGDVLIKVNSQSIEGPGDARGSGRYWVERGTRRFFVDLEASEFQMDQRPRVVSAGYRSAVLEVPSFEGKFEGSDLLSPENLSSLVSELEIYDRVLIDLRGNLGGNFVGALRLLSPFFCGTEFIGTLQRIGEDPVATGAFTDSLEFYDQWSAIEAYDALRLETFEHYGCFNGEVGVLVDSQTSSVSEIFAHALREVRGAPIFGHPTSGAVLVALREELMTLGKDFYLNLPILTYLDREGHPLEGVGVSPDGELHYSLVSFKAGKDNWVHDSLGLLAF